MVPPLFPLNNTALETPGTRYGNCAPCHLGCCGTAYPYVSLRYDELVTDDSIPTDIPHLPLQEELSISEGSGRSTDSRRKTARIAIATEAPLSTESSLITWLYLTFPSSTPKSIDTYHKAEFDGIIEQMVCTAEIGHTRDLKLTENASHMLVNINLFTQLTQVN